MVQQFQETPLYIRIAAAFSAPEFLQKLEMGQAEATALFRRTDWKWALRKLVPLSSRVSCSAALEAVSPLLRQIAPAPAEGWLAYTYQAARSLLYPQAALRLLAGLRLLHGGGAGGQRRSGGVPPVPRPLPGGVHL